MQPDETPRQPKATEHIEDSAAPRFAAEMGGGECGDAIWEYAACPGDAVVDGAAPVRPDAQSGAEDTVRGGRFISLDDHYVRRDQVNG